MSRFLFGGTDGDDVVSVYSLGGNQLRKAAPNVALTFWTDPTGGTQHTDILAAVWDATNDVYTQGSAVGSVSSDNSGFWGPVWLPDGVTKAWAQAASSTTRYLVLTSQLDSTDAAVSAAVQTKGGQTQKALDNAYGRGVHVGAHGAKGDGVTDDTAAISAAISAAQAFGIGRVYFPATLTGYLFSTLSVPGGIELEGDGYTLPANAPFGDAQYAAGAANAPKGSVLRSTATTGNAITWTGLTDPYRMRGLCVVGPGSGTSKGIAFGEATGQTTKHHIDDVMVCNFAQAWDLNGSEDSVYIHVKARGCQTGIELRNAANQNVFLNTEVQYSSSVGILTTDGGANLFAGILLQNTSGTASIHHVLGESNVYQSCYHESANAPTNLVLVDAGSYNVFRDWWLSSPGGQITFNGGGNNVLDTFNGAITSLPVVDNGTGNNLYRDAKNLSLSGTTGAPSSRIEDEVQIKAGPNADVRVNSGRRYYFETVGTGSYIGRNGTDGSTEIGTPGNVLSFPAMTASTTAPAAGIAGALPAAPAGYIAVRINGVNRVIPVY